MEKGKAILREFKEFISKGNAMNLAVGVIIGGAFQAIVNSLVNDMIMPVVSLFTSGFDFVNKLFIPLDGKFDAYATVEQAKAAGVATLNIGSFISAAINFFIMAIVIFAIVKTLNSLGSELKKHTKLDQLTLEEEKPAPRLCPFCKCEIAEDATRCPHCTSVLPEPESENAGTAEETTAEAAALPSGDAVEEDTEK